MNKIKELLIPTNARIIVISDIHGELDLFKELLEKVNFSKEDYLIVNGDLCEKGSNSIGVVSYIMELAATNSKVHVTEGNCDTLVEDLLAENPKLINYLCKRNSIISEWLEQLGYSINAETDVKEIKEMLLGHFEKEITWLTELPTAIETDNYIFVHAGLENVANWKDTARDTAITIPAFLEKSHRADKYVVVGHWPVVNYSSNVPSNNPIIDSDKRIIATDGGNTIKSTGQLNAFVINRDSSRDSFSYTYVDRLATCEVVADFHAEAEMVGSVSYPLYGITPVEKGANFTLCKQAETDQLYHVKNEYIRQDEAGNFTVKTDVSCAQLNVRKGDIVSLVDDSCTEYSLIKKAGEEGWVRKDVLANLMYT